MTYVQYSATKNDEIALELKRILSAYENTIETVDPNIINLYNNKTEEIKAQVQKKNETVIGWTYAEVNTEFNSLFDTSLGRLQALSGLIGLIAEGALTYMWNWYKTNRVCFTAVL